MIYACSLATAWLIFLVVGLVPRTTRRALDRLVGARWRASHVWLLGALVTVVGALAASRGLERDLWLAGAVAVGVPLVLLTATAAHRTRMSHVLGPHGSAVPARIESVWREVDGSHEVAPDSGSYWWAAAQLRGRLAAGATSPGPDTARPQASPPPARSLQAYRRLAGGTDLTPAQTARDRRWSLLLRGLASLVGALYLLQVVVGVLRRDAEPAWSSLGFPVAACLWGLAALTSWLGRRLRGGLSARRVRRLHVVDTWWTLAAVHGWRVTRPGVLPFAHWRDHPAFVSVTEHAGGTPAAVTLSGRVAGWDVWIVSGRAGRPRSGLVVALVLPGVWLPAVRLQRVPAVGGDLVRTAADPAADLREVLVTDAVVAHLAATMPAFADLVVHGDLVALALRPRIESEPWRADVMVACLLGLADLLPAEVLSAWLFDDNAAQPDVVEVDVAPTSAQSVEVAREAVQRSSL